MKSRSMKSGVKPKPKIKSKLGSLLKSNSAFAIENMIEAVLGIAVTMLLIILFAPIIMDLYLANFPNFGPEQTSAGAIWANLPYIVVVMLIIGGLLAVIMWFRGGGEGEIRGRV